MMTAKEIIAYMESLQNEEQRRVLMGFFKTGPGEYGEGDEFLGLKVPQTREVVKNAWKDFPLSEVPELLKSKWHEVRLCGLLILVARFEKLATKRLENDERITMSQKALHNRYTLEIIVYDKSVNLRYCVTYQIMIIGKTLYSQKSQRKPVPEKYSEVASYEY